MSGSLGKYHTQAENFLWNSNLLMKNSLPNFKRQLGFQKSVCQKINVGLLFLIAQNLQVIPGYIGLTFCTKNQPQLNQNWEQTEQISVRGILHSNV